MSQYDGYAPQGIAGGGLASLTPWTENIDGAGFTLSDAVLASDVDADAIANLVRNDKTNVFGDFNQDFKDDKLRIFNPADTFAFTFIAPAIAAARNITLPLLLGNDIIVTEAFAQILTNKTIDGDDNTLQDIDFSSLADGVDGELITWDAAGVIATVSVGTVGQILTSGGAGVAPTFQAAAGAGQSPWLSDIDGDGFDLKDLSNLEFRDTEGAPAGTVRAIYADSGGIILNVPTAKNFDFQFNGISKFVINGDANGIALGTNIDLRVGDNDITFDSINVSISSTSGRMFFDVTDNSDDFNWRFANTTKMVMNTVKLDIEDKFIELESIASPGVTGSATVGRLFMDSGNSNRLSTIRNGVVFDLETGLEITTWTQDHSMATFALIATAGNNVILNPPSGQATELQVNGTTEYTFSATAANFGDNILTDVSRYETSDASLASFGAFRLGNNEVISWKGISGDGSLKLDGADDFVFGIGGTTEFIIRSNEIFTNNGNVNMGSGLLQGGSGTDTLQWVSGNLIIDVADTFNYQFRVDNATIFTIAEAALTFIDAQDIIFNATTGTKIATATSQKLAFWGITPIVQPAHVADPSGGATVDAEARTAINSILAQLASLGLQAAA